MTKRDKNNLKNKVLVVIGVSRDENKYGFKVFKDLISKDFKVYGVNPKADYILGRKIYKKISHIPEKIDTVITVVPPKITEEIVDQCRQLSIKEIWMQPGSESKAAIKKAKDYGIKVVNQACIIKNTD